MGGVWSGIGGWFRRTRLPRAAVAPRRAVARPVVVGAEEPHAAWQRVQVMVQVMIQVGTLKATRHVGDQPLY